MAHQGEVIRVQAPDHLAGHALPFRVAVRCFEEREVRDERGQVVGTRKVYLGGQEYIRVAADDEDTIAQAVRDWHAGLPEEAAPHRLAGLVMDLEL